MDLEVYNRGIRIKNRSPGGGLPGKKYTRGNVGDFSSASRGRLSWVYAQGDWVSMLTLTYQYFDGDGTTSKSHLDAFLHSLRRRGIKYLWVLEFQKRGTPHYHVWMDRQFKDLPSWEDNEDKDSWRPIIRNWLNITNQNSEKSIKFALHQKTYTHWKVIAGSNYAAKYAQKSNQKELPDGVASFGRWWGCSRDAVTCIEKISVDTVNDSEAKKTFVKFNRQVQKAIEHWTGRQIKYRNPYNGGSYVLREERKHAIIRIYDQYREKFQNLEMYDYDRYRKYSYFGRKNDESKTISKDNTMYNFEIDKMVPLYQKYEMRFIPTKEGSIYNIQTLMFRARERLDRSSKSNADWVLFFATCKKYLDRKYITTNCLQFFETAPY